MKDQPITGFISNPVWVSHNGTRLYMVARSVVFISYQNRHCEILVFCQVSENYAEKRVTVLRLWQNCWSCRFCRRVDKQNRMKKIPANSKSGFGPRARNTVGGAIHLIFSALNYCLHVFGKLMQLFKVPSTSINILSVFCPFDFKTLTALHRSLWDYIKISICIFLLFRWIWSQQFIFKCFLFHNTNEINIFTATSACIM